jgi:hypothetical protein
MPERLLLPELARSLRTFGAPRDAAGDAANDAIFSPLLEARARAELGDVEAALSALRGGPLGTRIEARVTQAAAVAEHDPARARARAARASELVEPLVAELAALDALATGARGGTTDSPGWAAWVAQLRRVFASADDACRALARLLAEPAADARPPRRWFGSR